MVQYDVWMLAPDVGVLVPDGRPRLRLWQWTGVPADYRWTEIPFGWRTRRLTLEAYREQHIVPALVMLRARGAV